MRKKLSTEHICYVPMSGKVCCYHCGDSYQVTPCSLKMIVTILKQYGKEHKRCKETQYGKDLLAKNIAAFDAWENEDKHSAFGTLGLPENATLGDKIMHNLMMEEMMKQDLGPLTVEIKKATT